MDHRTGDRRGATAADRFTALLPLFVIWTAGLLVISFVLVQQKVPSEDLFMDATFVGGQRWYVGMVAALGMVAWTASVCFCLIASWVAGLADRRGAKAAFRGGGLLFALLLLDDLFLFHTDLLPRELGTPKEAVLGFYVILGAAWLLTSLKELKRTRFGFLMGAAAAFAVSLGVDVLVSGTDVGFRGAVEDSAKFLGILALALWAATSAADVIRSVVTEERDRHAQHAPTSGTV